MPQLPNGPFGPIPASVVLDGTGMGVITFQPNGKNARITNLFGKVSTEVKQATVNVYLGQVADSNRVFNNNSGSTGFNGNGSIDVADGQILYVVWTGGDAGATATATFLGTTVPFGQAGFGDGFYMDAQDPIAAGDGSLIYPALRSPNYVPGVSGWNLDRDGNIDLNDATIRGSLLVTDPNGSYILIDALSGATFIEMQPPQNLSLPTFPAQITTISFPPPADRTSMILYSPFISGQPQAFIELRSDLAIDCSIVMDAETAFDVTALDFYFRTPQISSDAHITTLAGQERYGDGFITIVSSTSSTAAIASTETVVFTTSTIDWPANRAFRMIMNNRYAVSGNPIPQIRLRKTNLAGQSLIDAGRIEATSSTVNKPFEAIFITGNAIVTASLVVTMQSQVTGAPTATMSASAGAPRIVEFYDIGPASRYSDYTALV